MRPFFIITIFWFQVAVLTSNASPIDSLERILPKTEGSEKVEVLNELFKQYLNNDPFLAMSYTKSALQISQEIEYTKGIANSYNNIGVIYRKQGKFDKAVDNYLKALNYYTEIGDKEGLAKIYNNVGTVYSLQGDHNKALENFEGSYKILQELNDVKRQIGSLNNIGNIYRAKGNPEKALEYYKKALNLYEKIGSTNQVFEPLMSIGNIYFEREEYNDALDVYFKSLEIERTNSNLNGQAYALNNIGIVYYNKEEYKMAISFQNQALNLASKIDNLPLLVEIYAALSKSYFANDEILNAYNALQLLNAAKDSLGNVEMRKRLEALEAEYEFEKKAAEAELAQQEKDIKKLKTESKRKSWFLIIVAAMFITSLFLGYFRMTLKNGKKKSSST